MIEITIGVIGMVVLLVLALLIRKDRTRNSSKQADWLKNWRKWDIDKLHRFFREEDPWTAAGPFLEAAADLDDALQSKLEQVFKDLGWEAFFIAGLTGSSREKRLLSAEMLRYIGGEKSVWPLLDALADKDDAVRFAASASLKQIRDSRLISALIDALGQPDRWLPARVAEVLIALEEDAVEAMVEALFTTGVSAKALIIEILGETRDGRAVPALIEVLKEPDPAIKAAAVKALGNMGDKEAYPYLIRALEDKAWEVRAMAAAALGRLAGQEAVAGLEKLLQDEDWRVQANAHQALRQIAAAKKV